MILKNRVKISIVVILLIIIQYQIIDSIANQNIGNDFTALTSPQMGITLGDEYANSNVYSDSPWYYNEDNAFGAPDGEYAVIHYDYDAGALILDMGNGEEIIDGNGNDLTIVAQGGNYSVKVTNDLSSPFTYLGFSKGSMSFDLADEGLSSVRYVCVEYLDGPSVELDAVIAIHYNQLPVITEVPEQTNFQWGQENTSLSWEVLNGEMWKLWKNDTQIRSGTVIDNKVEIKIENWQQDNWRLGTYNLTLQVSDENDTSTTSSIWIQIGKIFGDEYANSNVYSDSPWYYNEDNAFGAPDGEYAVIHYDYDAGALILDMGNGEEIIDENGNDLTIVAQGGNYSVKVTNDLSSPFTYLGFSKGNMSFDLADEGLSSVRYVCVEYLDGPSVELDAVIAIHYNQPEKDLNPPQINGPSNFWVWSNKTTATLAWEAFDVTPWNYTVLVDKIGFEKGPWNGSKIIFTLNLVGKNNVVNTTLVLYDLFGNRAKDTVMLEIRPTTITTGITLSSTSSTTTEPTPLSFLTLFMGFGVLLICHKYNTRRK